VSRADDERIDDIVEAASEISAIVEAGRKAWISDRVGSSRSNVFWKSLASRHEP
jgi:hypothetical protein